ncbi:MAG: YidC/Oxa1 family membrane protein insertase [Thermoguttaceae bacterium]
MVVWDQCVDLLRAAIFAYSQACGGNLGIGIVAVTFLVRMAMFPLTLHLARLSAAHQELMCKLKPELDRIRERFRNKPERMAQETQRLFEREGVSPLPLKGCLGTVVQMPIFLALFAAVRGCVGAGGRFLWIRNIARPDFVLTAVVTALTYATVALGASPAVQNKALMIAVPTMITFFVLLRMSAGIGLYWGVSSMVSLFQTAMIRRARLGVERAC